MSSVCIHHVSCQGPPPLPRPGHRPGRRHQLPRGLTLRRLPPRVRGPQLHRGLVLRLRCDPGHGGAGGGRGQGAPVPRLPQQLPQPPGVHIQLPASRRGPAEVLLLRYGPHGHLSHRGAVHRRLPQVNRNYCAVNVNNLCGTGFMTRAALSASRAQGTASATSQTSHTHPISMSYSRQTMTPTLEKVTQKHLNA